MPSLLGCDLLYLIPTTILDEGCDVQGLKPNVTYFCNNHPGQRLIYTNCGLLASGLWLENRALQSCLFI